MRIAIYSDLHLDVAGFTVPPQLDADVIVLAGDITSPGRRVLHWASRPSVFGNRPLVHVAGNHEFYGATYDRERRAMREAAARTGGHFLDASSVVIDGVRFLGCTLWTDFELRLRQADGSLRATPQQAERMVGHSLNDYLAIRFSRVTDDARPFRTLLRTSDTLAIHRAERAWLAEAMQQPFSGPTVVVTHHAPHRGSLAPTFAQDLVSSGYVSELPDSFFEVPVLWVHGHTHSSFDYRVGNCRVVCNPRGYQRPRGECENEHFDPMLVVEVGR